MDKSFWYLAIVLVAQCSSPSDIPLPESGQSLIFGHGGSGFGIVNTPYAANSMESIKGAILFHGADGIELDIQITKDQQIIVFHDADLSAQTTCSGCIQSTTFDQIKDCYYRRGLLPTEDESPVLLRDVFEFFLQTDSFPRFSLNVQLRYGCLEYDKWDSMDRAFANQLAGLVGALPEKSRIMIESEHLHFLDKVKTADPTIKRMWIAKASEEHIEMAKLGEVDGFICDYQETTENQIRLLKAHGFEIALFNANIRSDIKSALKWFPDYLQTDQIILSRQMRSKLH